MGSRKMAKILRGKGYNVNWITVWKCLKYDLKKKCYHSKSMIWVPNTPSWLSVRLNFVNLFTDWEILDFKRRLICSDEVTISLNMNHNSRISVVWGDDISESLFQSTKICPQFRKYSVTISSQFLQFIPAKWKIVENKKTGKKRTIQSMDSDWLISVMDTTKSNLDRFIDKEYQKDAVQFHDFCGGFNADKIQKQYLSTFPIRTFGRGIWPSHSCDVNSSVECFFGIIKEECAIQFSEEYPSLRDYVQEFEHRMNYQRKECDPKNKFAFKEDNLLSKLICGT